jgi:hypothetical protein
MTIEIKMAFNIGFDDMGPPVFDCKFYYILSYELLM